MYIVHYKVQIKKTRKKKNSTITIDQKKMFTNYIATLKFIIFKNLYL